MFLSSPFSRDSAVWQVLAVAAALVLLLTAAILLFRKRKAPETIPAEPAASDDYAGDTVEMPAWEVPGQFFVEQDITLISTGDK